MFSKFKVVWALVVALALASAITGTAMAQDPDNEPPMITSVSGHVTIGTGDTTELWAYANDNVGVTSAMIYIDGTVYSMMWNGTYWKKEYTAPISNISTHTYTITVYDAAGNSNSSSLYNIFTFDNDPPAITAGSGNLDADIGETLTLWTEAVDNIGVSSAEISIDSGTPVAMTWDAGNSRWEYVYTVSANGHVGHHSYFLTVYDAAGNSNSGGPYNINRPPEFAPIGDKVVNEGDLLVFAVSASDPDSDSLILSATNLPDGADFTDNGDGTGIFSWTPDYADAGTYVVDFIVWDGEFSDSKAIEIIVLEYVGCNAPPVITLDPPAPYSVKKVDTLTILVTASDPEGNYFTLSALWVLPGQPSPPPSGATFTDNGDGSGTFKWSPADAQSDAYYFRIMATDSEGSISAVDITIEVTNTPPMLDPIGNRLIDEGDTLTILVTASDPDGDSLILSATDLPDGADFTDYGDGTGTFSWTTDYDDAGTYEVTLKASDGPSSDIESITIIVNNVNRAPILKPIGPKEVNEGTLLQFTITATDPDMDTDPTHILTYSVDNLPFGATFNPITRIFSWTPSESQGPGTYLVTFTVIDNGVPQLSDSETITITVNALPLPDIAVSLLNYDFGNVELGSSSTAIVTVSNVGTADLEVSDISLQSGSISDYAITGPTLPAVIAPGGVAHIEITITFTPSGEGSSSAVLGIVSNDPDEPSVQVTLSGTGVRIETPPSEQIANILTFFNTSVDGGTLIGSGSGNSAENRLNALRNMIEAAGDLIDDGMIAEASQQLLDAYQKCDGQPKPPDFVSGPAASELASMIQELLDSLGG